MCVDHRLMAQIPAGINHKIQSEITFSTSNAMLRSLALILCLTCTALAQKAEPKAEGRKRTYPPQMEGAKVETYKKVGDTELKVWIFSPKEPVKNQPAIVFFFGGGWKSGSPTQFERHCRHFAERGIVGIAADYRVASRHDVKPAQCVADAKSCVRWIRTNAERLGVDPERIVAAGGSAGGHLAAATATLPTLDEPGEDAKISSQPNALILFNPCLITAPIKDVEFENSGRFTVESAGCEPTALSPMHHLREKLPPTLILHGKADKTVPYNTVEAYANAAKKLGNRCELIGYDGQPHGFFNAAKYAETLQAADDFLVSLKYLEPAKKSAAK
jgi:acetyl esterase